MSGPTRRVLEQRVAGLREDVKRDGFHRVQIGGDPELGGFYEWDAEAGEYVNEHGRTMTPEDAPDSDFEYKIEWTDE